ncbi:hypothetical protein NQ315_002852 [Exocentrus adspersus]|uniref:Tyr recombinase domain-containing protein n=1 Tax=Exocentrus adspersus TaxID=1586481 RepID=A0AAV8V5G2_9CUCU|nr:hypothetical protein NQ315_002852 [Exocentrus adspersus]
MSDTESDVPSDIEEAAQRALSTVIPTKSKLRYDGAYTKFTTWCEDKKVKQINEKVLLAYFQGKKNMKSSTLWSLYSMLRTKISLKRNVDSKKYTSLISFLKRHSDGYQPKKSNILTKENIVDFLTKADDVHYLMAKASTRMIYLLCMYLALIIRITGACRKSELTFLRVENVTDQGQYMKVTIPNTETKIFREFAITSGGIEGLNFIEIVRKYICQTDTYLHETLFWAILQNHNILILSQTFAIEAGNNMNDCGPMNMYRHHFVQDNLNCKLWKRGKRGVAEGI